MASAQADTRRRSGFSQRSKLVHQAIAYHLDRIKLGGFRLVSEYKVAARIGGLENMLVFYYILSGFSNYEKRPLFR